MRHLPLLLTILLGACATTPGGHRMMGLDWRASDINGVPVLPSSLVTLRLDERDAASGNAGCNSFSGQYKLMSKEGIRFSALTATRKACAPEIMDQERRVLSILEAAQGYSFYSDGGFSLIAADGRAIRFRR